MFKIKEFNTYLWIDLNGISISFQVDLKDNFPGDNWEDKDNLILTVFLPVMTWSFYANTFNVLMEDAKKMMAETKVEAPNIQSISVGNYKKQNSPKKKQPKKRRQK